MIKTTLCIILATALLFTPQDGNCVSGNPVLEGDDAKFSTVTLNADPTPGYTGDDNDTTVETEDWKIYGNATDAGTGTEDVDIYLQTQINSVLTSVFHVDADGDFNILALDLRIAGDIYADGGAVQAGLNGQDGQITIYSEQGGTDYSVVFNPHASMTQTTTYTLPADDGTNLQVLHTDGGGALSWGNDDSAGNTALDDIADPDAASSITCADNETLTFLSSEDTGIFFNIQDDDVALAGVTTLEELHFSGATYDGISNAIYLNMKDYTTTAYTFSGVQFSSYRPIVSYEGNAAGAGYEAFTVSQNLEAMDDAADICTGFYVGWTNADHAAGILQAFNAEDITGDAESTEKAFRVGTGWDHALNAESGDFHTSHALDWDLIDNNAAGLSFDATDKAGILRVVTTDAGEGVTMSGTLTVTGAGTLSTGGDFNDADITSVDKLEGVDAQVYIDMGADGIVEIESDTIISAEAPNIQLRVDSAAYLNIATADAGASTISATSDGQDQIIIGDGSDSTVIKVAAGADAMADDNYSGVVLSGWNCGEAITQWDTVYLDDTSNEWMQADADAAGEFPARGVAVAGCTDGNPGIILVQGTIRNDGWTWTGNGKTLYLSDTVAGMTETAPSTANDCVQVVGFSLDDDTAYVNFSGHWLLVE